VGTRTGEPVSWPCRVGVIPASAECFQHRAAAADALEAAVADGGTAVLTQVLLAGPGGVGKTQLAASYARATWDAKAVDLLIWVTADSRAAVISAFADAGAQVAGADHRDPEQAARRLRAWLQTTDRPWLVVLDDLADPADMQDLWPPLNRIGRVLVTTRRRDAVLRGEGRCVVDVGLFTPAEAAAYVTAKLAAQGRADQPEQIDILAAEMGYLPVALAQATAYIADLGLDCGAYCARLADRRRQLPDLVPERSGLPDDQLKTVAATWSLSVEQADLMRPAGLARPMLELASMLDPNGIPAAVLTSEPALEYLTRYRCVLGGQGRARPTDAQDAADALRCLHRLSLAELDSRDSEHTVVRVHNMIQRATREGIPEDRLSRLTQAVATALTASFPEIGYGPLAAALGSSTSILADHIGAELWRQDDQEPLAGVHGKSPAVGASASLDPDVMAMYEFLVAERSRVLGPVNDAALAGRAKIARMRGEAGDPASAAAEFAEMLADCTRLLGADNHATLAVRASLARWQGAVGDPAAAAAGFRELLADRLRVLGPDHPSTRTTSRNLAYWLAVASAQERRPSPRKRPARQTRQPKG
jgi:NB-ARC domain